MSIINRMLADLEHRGASTRRDSESGSDLRASPPPRRRRRPQARQLLIVMAVVLTVVAAALWVQRGGRILGAWPSLAGASTPPARLLRMSFEQADGRSTLRLRVDGELARPPRYHRNGGSATLVVDAASGDLLLPAPPPGQRVFRALALEPVADTRTRIRLEVEPAAELDLTAQGRRIALVGTMPEPAAPETAVAVEEAEAATVATAPEPAAAPAVPAASEGSGESARSEPGATSLAVADAASGAGAEAPAGGTTAGADAQAAQPDPAAAAAAATVPEAAGETVAELEVTTAEAQPAATDAGPEVEVTTEEGQPAATDAGHGAGKATLANAAGGSPAAVAERAADEAQAVGSVRKTQSMSPEVRARRRYREAREALDGGELAGARRALQEALDLDPSLHAARDLLVALVRRAGDTVVARRLLADGVELAPARVRFAMPYARLLVDTGELDRAVAVLEAARVGGSGAADFHALLAAIEQRRGQHRAAAAEYTRALELQPGNGLWWLGLGISLAAIENPREAQSAFREARASGTLEPSLDRWAQDRIEGLNVKAEG